MAQRVAVHRVVTFLAATLLLTSPATAVTADSDTFKQWQSYGDRLQSKVRNAAQEPERFLWLDGSIERKAAVLAGETVVEPMLGRGYVVVSSGLIHHWVGALFMPDTSAEQLVNSLQDFAGYSNIYAPAVTKSKLLSHSGDQFTYSLTIVGKALTVKTGLRGEFDSRFVSGPNGLGYSITKSTKLWELSDPDGAHEQTVTPDQAHGYVQRILTVVRYREEGSGVFVEVESATLSRDIPAAVRWIAGPIVERVSRETMWATLDKLRANLHPVSAHNSEKNRLGNSFRRSLR